MNDDLLRRSPLAEPSWFETDLVQCSIPIVELEETELPSSLPTVLLSFLSPRTPPTLMFPAVRLFLFFTFASTVAIACEGECIVNVTKFILHNYDTPVYDVFRATVSNLPTHSRNPPPLISQIRLKKSKLQLFHPPPALLVCWTISPLSFRLTSGVPILAWKPRSSRPTSTENARTQRRVSLRPGAQTRLALSSVGHQVRWLTTFRNSGESRSTPYMRYYSNTRGRVQIRMGRLKGSSNGSRSPRLRRT